MSDDPIAATQAHAPALAAIHAAAFPRGERWGADAISLQLGLPGAFGLVSPRGGFILARSVVDEAEILTLAVDPAARRHGIGRALMTRAMHTAGQRGAVSMFLEVAETNAAARALYVGCGFSEMGRRVRYYSGGIDALVLRATISS